MQSIAEKLKAVRLRRGLTLKTVATAIGVSESMISQIERGQVSPSIDTLLGLAETLEVRLEYLFEGTGPAKSASVVRGRIGSGSSPGASPMIFCRLTRNGTTITAYRPLGCSSSRAGKRAMSSTATREGSSDS